VETHPAFPHRQKLTGVLQQIEIGRVKQRIAQPPAQNDPQRAVEEQVIGMALRQGRAGRLYHPRQVPVAEDDARQIGERVKAQREEAQVDPIRQAQIQPVNRSLPGGSGGCQKQQSETPR